MRPANDNALAILLWLEDQGKATGRLLSSQQSHHLLYLAVQRFAALTQGQLLAPVAFTAWHNGPREANLYGLSGDNSLAKLNPPPRLEIMDFLALFWRQCQSKTLAVLEGQVLAEPAFQAALSSGEGTLIDWEYLIEVAAFEARAEALPSIKIPTKPTPPSINPTATPRPFSAPQSLTPKSQQQPAADKPTASPAKPANLTDFVVGPQGQRYQRWIPPIRK